MNIRTGWFRLPERLHYEILEFDPACRALTLLVSSQVWLTRFSVVTVDALTLRQFLRLDKCKNWRKQIDKLLEDLKRRTLIFANEIRNPGKKLPSSYIFILPRHFYQKWEKGYTPIPKLTKTVFEDCGEQSLDTSKNYADFWDFKREGRILRCSVGQVIAIQKYKMTLPQAKMLAMIDDQITMLGKRPKLYDRKTCPLLAVPMISALGSGKVEKGWRIKGLMERFGHQGPKNCLKDLQWITEEVCNGKLYGRLPCGSWVHANNKLTPTQLSSACWYPFLPESWVTAPFDGLPAPSCAPESPPTKLKRQRLENGMTQKDLAEKLSVTERTIKNWEAGRTKVPSRARNWFTEGERKAPFATPKGKERLHLLPRRGKKSSICKSSQVAQSKAG